MTYHTVFDLGNIKTLKGQSKEIKVFIASFRNTGHFMTPSHNEQKYFLQ